MSLKLSSEFLTSVPTCPGIYQIFDHREQIIYVGKAKNLRRRLGQYKNPNRRKKHRKMRKILEFATRVHFETCSTDLDACLLEMERIQQYRPKWNVVGAFYFLYPLIGVKWELHQITFCLTTQPELLKGFSFHGAFRSRTITRDAFFSLMELLGYIGHKVPRNQLGYKEMPKYSYICGFRQIPQEWSSLWDRFYRGESKEALEALVFALLENAGARQASKKVQEKIQDIARFWDHEVIPLFKARSFSQYTSYPVKQKDRDLIFLRFKNHS